MEKQSCFSDAKRQKILEKLEESPKKFVELKKIIGLESNILSYNLKILIRESLVNKNNLYYELTEKALKLAKILKSHKIDFEKLDKDLTKDVSQFYIKNK